MARTIDERDIVRRMKDVDLLVCDADGTLRRVRRKPARTAADWELMPNVRETFRGIDWSRVRLGVATNQPEIGRGRITLEGARRALDEMLDAAGVPADRRAIEVCPHHQVDCVCHKPLPGMLVRLMDRTGVTPKRTLVVGNAGADRRSARSAGARYADAGAFFARASPIRVAMKSVAERAIPT